MYFDHALVLTLKVKLLIDNVFLMFYKRHLSMLM